MAMIKSTFKEMYEWYDIPLRDDLKQSDIHAMYDWCNENMQGRYVLGYVYLTVEDKHDAFMFSIRWGSK